MKQKIKTILLFIGYIIFHNRKSKVLYYHDIHIKNKYTDMSTDFKYFKMHLHVIRKNGFNIVKFISNKQNEIMICFDDGWKGIYNIKDYLVDNNIFPTIFIASDLIGKEGYLTKKEILELQDLGFNFQSHTISHRDLTTLSDVDAQYEIFESRKQLQILLNKNIDSICFPSGRFSSKIYEMGIKAGYFKLYSSLPGCFKDNNNILIYRNLVQFSSCKDLKYILYGGEEIMIQHMKNIHIAK